MGVMMDDSEERLEARLGDAVREYHQPPPTPKAEIWARIRAVREAGATARGPGIIALKGRPRWSRGPLPLLTGLAAVLLLGIGIGRLALPGIAGTGMPLPGAVVSSAPGNRARPDLATSIATAQHFSEAESFLTEFRVRPGDSTFSRSAKTLLATTRLLLDSKRVTDARTRQLLGDLEFILVQIATLDPTHRPRDLDAITEDLSRNHLRTRLRNAAPAGPAIGL
jgi:hypothetical protein